MLTMLSSMPAIVMQIKLAISNLEPRPARLAPDWNRDYQVGEALQGYKRAAQTHGWQVISTPLTFYRCDSTVSLGSPWNREPCEVEVFAGIS